MDEKLRKKKREMTEGLLEIVFNILHGNEKCNFLTMFFFIK
jgi:hypothetical protein